MGNYNFIKTIDLYDMKIWDKKTATSKNSLKHYKGF